MYKIRSKKLTILLTLIFALSIMLPLAGPAGAATTNQVTAAPSVGPNAGAVTLGSVFLFENADQAGTAFPVGTAVNLTVTILTSGVTFTNVPVTVGTEILPLGTLGAANTVVPADIAVAAGATNKTYTATVTASGPPGSTRGGIQLAFPVTIAAAPTGPIEVEVSAPDTGVTGGTFVIGHVAGTGTTTSVLSTSTRQLGTTANTGMVRIQEDRMGTWVAGDVVRLEVPEGFTLMAATAVAMSGGTAAAAPPALNARGRSEIAITLTAVAAGVRSALTITPNIAVATDANIGDITLRVSGTGNTTTQTVVIGSTKDFGVTASGPVTMPEVIAGATGQALGAITIKENVAGSLIGGRTFEVRLPSYAKWQVNPTISITGTAGAVTAVQPAGQTIDNDRTRLSFTVAPAGTATATTVTLKDAEIYLAADAPAGDIVAEIVGHAGVTGKVVVAKVVAPVAAAVVGATNVGIGVQNQAVGDITIAEYKQEVLLASVRPVNTAATDRIAFTLVAVAQTGELVLETPRGAWFASKPTVKVAEGNLKLSTQNIRLAAGDTQLIIPISSSGTQASSIAISDIKLNLDRTVPMGDLRIAVTGNALDRTSPTNNVAVALAKVATVGTPAPVDKKRTAVFVIGSTTYTVGGVEATMDVAPYVKAGRTYLPVRFAGYALGVAEENIFWDNRTGTATLIKGDRVVQFTVGQKAMVINGASIAIDVAPEITNGRTMLPFRWIATAFGAGVAWDAATQTVTMDL